MQRHRQRRRHRRLCKLWPLSTNVIPRLLFCRRPVRPPHPECNAMEALQQVRKKKSKLLVATKRWRGLLFSPVIIILFFFFYYLCIHVCVCVKTLSSVWQARLQMAENRFGRECPAWAMAVAGKTHKKTQKNKRFWSWTTEITSIKLLQVTLQEKTRRGYFHKCGASLLSKDWVITAAHCLSK